LEVFNVKFSKSILIFIFVSSTLSTFYYGLKRTDGNVCKSIMFTMYFLAIKTGYIGPNVPLELNQHQPNPQLVSRIQTGAAYNPYVSVLDNYRGSGLYMDNIKHPIPQHYVSYHSQSVIKELRAGSRLTDAAWFLLTIWMLQQQSVGFQPVRQAPPPAHLQWLYGNNYQPGQFGHGKGVGPRRITVTEMTQNAGSDKNQPSSGSWDYKKVMRELDRQSSKKRIDVQVGDQVYTLKNPYREGPYELGDKLADQFYESIRKCDTDICDIAENLGFKADNIKNVKDHVFYNEHDLDRYGPDQIERKQFDPNLEQALAWKRLETGTHTQDDVTWVKHECAERHHELKYGSGYNEAHNRAQTRFDGAPWENQF
jgi:hypothetical protein